MVGEPMTTTPGAAPLVGREAPLAQLEALLDGLDAGREQWLAVTGEPGIGKTRLLAELRARSEKRGHLVLDAAASEFERDLPYGVWIDALDAHVASRELAAGWDEAALEA